MKPTTDPTSGKTTCELSTQDRKSLATAKTVLEQLACYLRGTEPGTRAKEVADGVGRVLSDPTPTLDPKGALSGIDPEAGK